MNKFPCCYFFAHNQWASTQTQWNSNGL